MSNRTQKPTLEDILELSGIDILHPGGFEITKRIGKIVSLKGKEVLDVACGRGTLPCYYAKRFGAKIIGIDLSSEMIESAVKRAVREKVEDLTEFKVADALALSFEDNSFDVVINECAVGLTSNPQKCLDEMTRVTKPGGYVVIHESTWLSNMAEEEKTEIVRRLGTVPYTLSEWKEMLLRAGLTNLWTENWSRLENLYKVMFDREVQSIDKMFSLLEKVFTIYPKIVSRYGIKGMFHAYESTLRIIPLYLDRKLGYFLIKGQKTE